jgi:hypothetical protein
MAERTAANLIKHFPGIDVANRALVIEKCMELPEVKDPKTGDLICQPVDLRPRSGCPYAYGNVRPAAEFQLYLRYMEEHVNGIKSEPHVSQGRAG